MAQAAFNCPQSDLIVVMNTGLASVMEHLPAFTNFSRRYDKLFIDTLSLDIATAAAMPNEAARRLESLLLRDQLLDTNKLARQLWKALKRYIVKAYSPSQAILMLNAAGQAEYTAGSDTSWANTLSLLTTADTFLTTRQAELEADLNMPPDFREKVTTMKNEISPLITKYEKSKAGIPTASAKKVEALNVVFKRFMVIMKDGQEIFQDDEDLVKLFIFAEIYKLVAGHGLAGIWGKITDESSKLAVPSAAIRLVNADDVTYRATADENGNYTLNCPSGNYTCTFEAPGYSPKILEKVVVSVGTESKLNVTLEPLPSAKKSGV